jgi:hypothetical protein
LVSRALSYSFRRGDSVVAAQIEAMQCVDTAFAHAAFDGHRITSLTARANCLCRVARRSDLTTLRS